MSQIWKLGQQRLFWCVGSNHIQKVQHIMSYNQHKCAILDSCHHLVEFQRFDWNISHENTNSMKLHQLPPFKISINVHMIPAMKVFAQRLCFLKQRCMLFFYQFWHNRSAENRHCANTFIAGILWLFYPYQHKCWKHRNGVNTSIAGILWLF